MGVGIVRLAPHCFFETGDAFVELALVLEHQAQIITRFEIVWVDRQCLPVARLRRVMPPKRAQRIAEVGMAAGMADGSITALCKRYEVSTDFSGVGDSSVNTPQIRKDRSALF